ncbi:MAG TPA: GNAT family N-acetyltransferase [Pyrinomonadaceae bacterium]|nr:GNAT family N-acetyltransferase [Pyrinomonadaceae bacterium]
MTESHASRTTPDAGARVSLRPVAPEDDEFLLGVYASTRDAELSQVEWAPGQREAFLRMQFDAQRGEYSARFPDAQYEVILLDGRPVGRFWVGRDDEQIRLLDIALLPEAQKQGVGTLLVGRLIEEARETGKALRHMVFLYNPEAKRLYERLGFEVIEDLGAYAHMEWKGTDGGRAGEV